ncbi:multicopper oxidase [Boeremia exigua]|uniref:multicopper oxidase n=1 Tax=Boeremia exigua TaxID=749465 RepID=UPI001E8E250B|nr:multicopper oxidase [Boeremia exigua]KAH6639585.1 multicopper oxidase [Boeremia exigua]
MSFRHLFTAAALLSAAQAHPSTSHHSHPHLLSSRDVCSGNTASTRSEWCDYSVDTDYLTEVPDTGVTKEYWLTLDEVTVAPDGVSRSAMTVNGTIPGPTLFADWGDTVTVHVKNNLVNSQNGTSLHWHGIRQNYTNDQDGVVSITQCATAPDDTTTYTWRATQYGSTWYHSHFALQAWQGIFGGLVINGPATANYDEDLGMLFLFDWDHQTVDELYPEAESSGPPELDNALINGTNIFEDGGYRFNTSFVSGTSYRIRLVNTAIDTHFKFMIDNHTMTVIAADLVPITPYETTVLSIGMAQRYDIIVTADQASVADNFWLRAIPQSACSENSNSDNVRGIIYYGDSPSTPTTEAYSYDDNCDDETDNLVPHVSKTVGTESSTNLEVATVGFNSESLFRWYLNSTTMIVEWGYPTLEQIVTGNTSYATSNAVLELPDANVWTYLVIQTTLPVTHPIHLHGHDFFVLAQGTGTYDSSVSLKLDNPIRRDTAMLPASGYLVLGFETDNPGAWLMHCHIGWHTTEGFALQFIERIDEIAGITNQTRLEETCDNWNSHATTAQIEQTDSGV